MAKRRTIAIMTGGGDAPGLNAVIRAVVKRAVLGHGWHVLGIRQATHGLLSRPVDAIELSPDRVAGILNLGGTLLGTTPYPLGSAEFSAHLPRIQAAKPDVLMNVAPGADNVALHKQVISYGMKKEMKIAQPLHWISYLKEGGAELYQDVYGGINWYWELQEQIPTAKKFVEASMKKFGLPPGDYAAYSYSGVLEVARGVELAKSTDSDAVANALRKNPTYDHFKGKQWWRACDNKSFQDMWIARGRGPGQTKGDWGLLDLVARVPANEEYDRSCAEKGHA